MPGQQHSGIPMPVSSQRMGTTIDGHMVGDAPTQLAPGALIALNLERCTFIAAPDGSFFMNAGHPSCRIPYDVTEEVLHALQQELRLKKIVLGDTPHEPTPDPRLIEKFLHAVDKAEVIKDLESFCKQAAGTNRMGLTPVSIYEEMIKRETLGKCRPSIINYISQWIVFTGGPGAIEDMPADHVQVTMSRAADGSLEVPRTEEQSETLKELI